MNEFIAIRAVCDAHQKARRMALLAEMAELRTILNWYQGALNKGRLLAANELLTPPEAGELLGLRPLSIYALIRRGELKTVWRGNRYAIEPEELERCMRERGIGGEVA